MPALSGRGCGAPLPNYFIKQPISGMDLDAGVKSLPWRVCPAFLRSPFALQLRAHLGCKNTELVSAPLLLCEWSGAGPEWLFQQVSGEKPGLFY